MTTTPEQSVPMSDIIYAFSPDYVRCLISRVLQLRSKASKRVRNTLNSAITDSISLDGFRDASKAPPHMLKESVLQELLDGNDRLAGAVLLSWIESQKELYNLVVRHLGGQDIPVDGPNFKERVFDSLWPWDEWMRALDAIVERNGDLDEDDVGMMLCCVSGMSPASPEEELEIDSPVLSEWVDRLRELPPEAPEWDDALAFLKTVTRIAEEKAAELIVRQVESLVETITALRRDFESEMRYLGLSLDSWTADIVEGPPLTPDALELAEALKDNLVEYRTVRPQADSREEERLRAVERAERESAILDIAARWDRLMSPPDDPDGSPAPDGPGVRSDGETQTVGSDDSGDGGAQADTQPDEQPSPGPGGSVEAGEPDRAVPVEEYNALLSERDRLGQDSESRKSENARLTQASSDLESDRRALDSENSALRDDLSQSRDMEETWRRAYVSAKAAGSGRASEAPALPSTVNEAVSRAAKSFPEHLVFALNSKSAKNSPFQKPDEVFDALAWLATVYHQRRTKPGSAPRFDKLLKESCSGWSYKPKQTDLTKGQFDEWYTTTVDGKTYDLDAHLGKGNSHDPKNTFRIAFAWDDERNQVIVGYIGPHQRNRRS